MKRNELAMLPGRIPASTVEKYSREANGNETFFGATGASDGFDTDPYFMAAGSAVTSTEPYIVNIKNVGLTEQTAVLFGNDIYSSQTNYGSDADIEITMDSVDYVQLLKQSSTQNFEIALMRVETSDLNQLIRPFQLYRKTANAVGANRPINTSSYRSPDQFANNMIDIVTPIKIDGSTYMTYKVKPATEIMISFFISAKVNVGDTLQGSAPIQEFTQQRLRTFGTK